MMRATVYRAASGTKVAVRDAALFDIARTHVAYVALSQRMGAAVDCERDGAAQCDYLRFFPETARKTVRRANVARR